MYFLMGTDLYKCIIASLAHRWILCSVEPFESAIGTFNPLAANEVYYMEKNLVMFSSKTLIYLTYNCILSLDATCTFTSCLNWNVCWQTQPPYKVYFFLIS